MPSSFVTWAFCAAVLASLATKFWLASRQMRHVHAHRQSVPPAFAGQISVAAHQKAADYTVVRSQFGLLTEAFGAAVLLGWTLLGGLDALNTWVYSLVQPALGDLAYQLALFGLFSLIGGALDLPFSLWQVFRIEQRFGFNRMTLKLFIADMLKGSIVGILIGVPLLSAVLWLMNAAGSLWWLWAWGLWAGFILLMQLIYPTLIAPLFNRFAPLEDPALTSRVQALMQRCGFKAQGFFVMDGSRRSAHGNAYFTGLGRSKRVVFYDTLLARLQPTEVEAVLAHELGHFHHKHVLYNLFTMLGVSLAGLALLGWLSGQMGFYTGLGVSPNVGSPSHALALILFGMVLPPFMFFVSPLMALRSRKAEFEADAYASEHADGQALSQALLKLYEDNANTLTPDPLYVRFYYSHPAASERLAALAALSASRPAAPGLAA